MRKSSIKILTVNTTYLYEVRTGKETTFYTLHEFSNLATETITYLVYDDEGHVVRSSVEIIEAFRNDLKALS